VSLKVPEGQERGAVQVWCVPIMGKAVKVRTVELPFVAMAWVTPTPQVRCMHCLISEIYSSLLWNDL
jgi:hypothetical protein